MAEDLREGGLWEPESSRCPQPHPMYPSPTADKDGLCTQGHVVEWH